MRGAGALAGLCVFSALSACGAQQTTPTGQVWVECSAACLVEVDEQAAARARGPVAMTLPVGTRRVAVSAPGYLTQRFDVIVRPGRAVELVVVLWPALHGMDDSPSRPSAMELLLGTGQP